MATVVVNKERFLPTRLSNLSVWLDAADPSTIIQSRIAIEQWNDKSSNSNVFMHGSAFSAPVVSNTSTNAPSVFFPPGARLSGNSQNLPQSASVFSKSCIAVYQCQDANAVMRISIGRDASGGAFGLAQSNGIVYAPYQYAEGDTTFSITNVADMRYVFASFDASVSIITGLPSFSDMSMNATAYINNILNTSFSIGTSDNPNSVFQSSNFHLCELIATSNALSTSDREDVEGYLAWKWNISASLPSTHPYAYFPPSGEQVISTVTPTSISGLVSWLDMSDPTQYNTNLTTIGDKLGGQFTVTGSLSLAVINGLTALNLQGNGQYLSKSISMPNSGSGFIVFFPVNGLIPYQPLLGWGPPSGRKTSPELYLAGSNINSGTTTNGVPSSTNFTQALNIAGSTIAYWAWNGGNTVYLSVNGSTLSTYFTPNMYTLNSGLNTFYIGDDNGQTTSVQIGEVLLYNNFLEQAERQIVEGYLAWKWNLAANNLPPWHPYRYSAPNADTTPESVALAIPSQFKSLSLWLDAADTSTLTLSGNSTTVLQWNDKSPIESVFSQQGSYTLPTYAVQGLGPNLPAVYFNGLTDSLISSSNSQLDGGVGTTFLVATAVGTGQIFTGEAVLGSRLGRGDTFGLFLDNTGLLLSPIQGGDNSNTNTIPFIGAFMPPGAAVPPTVLFAEFSGTYPYPGGGSWNFGTVDNYGTRSETWNPTIPVSTPWVLGYNSGSPLPVNFYIHEFLCFTEFFSDSQRQTVEGYLAWKWGLQNMLPFGHPYANTRPV